ncbi:MAG: hypothetical protein Q9P90_04190 [candidate division KSB1 bacterium]|nr:hypothetical protein [candidate division KSB1 bacterium]
MRTQKFWLMGLFVGLLAPAATYGQFEMAPAPGRLSIGASGGFFRISYDDFDNYYKGRTGFVYGGHVNLRVKAPYHLVVKYRQFSKSTTFQDRRQTYDLNWRQRWINVGVRYMGIDRETMSNYFSFGFAFFDIVETGGVSVFSGVLVSGDEKKTTASGFFIDFGLHYPLSPRMAVNFDVELTSAGPKGKSGFEGTSVGGFLFGIGLVLFLF